MNTPKDTSHPDNHKQLRDKEIKSEEGLQQNQAGNNTGTDAEKDRLSGPAIDLVSQPGKDDG